MSRVSVRRYAALAVLALTAGVAVLALTAGPSAAWGGKGGCTPGFWKNNTDEWGPTGYSPGQSVSSVFSSAPSGLGSATLLDALSFGGGPGLEGAMQQLLQHAVAALLNAAHPNVNYPASPSDVIQWTNDALDGSYTWVERRIWLVVGDSALWRLDRY